MALLQSEQLLRSLAWAVAETLTPDTDSVQLSAALQRLVPNMAYRGYDEPGKLM